MEFYGNFNEGTRIKNKNLPAISDFDFDLPIEIIEKNGFGFLRAAFELFALKHKINFIEYAFLRGFTQRQRI